MGFVIKYNKTYSDPTTSDLLDNIRNGCETTSKICVGGGATGDDTLRLVACGNCLNVLTETQRNKPQQIGTVFWYWQRGMSFGFSPKSKINQANSDVNEPKNEQRLSWHVDNNFGGKYLAHNHKKFFSTCL